MRKEFEEIREKKDQEKKRLSDEQMKKENELKIALDEVEEVKKHLDEEKVLQEGVVKDIGGIQTQIDAAKNEEEKKTTMQHELSDNMTRVHDEWEHVKSTLEMNTNCMLSLQKESDILKSQHADLLEVIHSLTVRSSQLQQTLLEKESAVRETIETGNPEMLMQLNQKRKELVSQCTSLGTELTTSGLKEAISTVKEEIKRIHSGSSGESHITDEDLQELADQKQQLEKELQCLQTTPIDVSNDHEIHSVGTVGV